MEVRGTTPGVELPAQTEPAVVPEEIVRLDKVDRAFSDLTADFQRQGGFLEQAQFDRLVLRRNLSPAEMVAVLTRLHEGGIRPSEPGQNQDESSANTASVSDAVAAAPRRHNPYALLSGNEEIELGRRIQLAQRVEATIRPHVTPSDDEQAIIDRGKLARDRMMLANLRLIRFVIASVRRPTRSMDSWDLFQEGTIGLMRAIDRFDPELGLRFATYAVWWIRQSIFRGLDDQDLTIRVPVHRLESIRRMKSMNRRLAAEYGREPSIRDLSEALQWPLEKTVFIQRLTQLECISIDAPIGGADDERTIGDRIASTEPSPYDTARSGQRRDLLKHLLERLSPRQRLVIERRFGLNKLESGETLQQIGTDFDVSRERIRQIEEKALARLRKWIDRRLYEALT